MKNLNYKVSLDLSLPKVKVKNETPDIGLKMKGAIQKGLESAAVPVTSALKKALNDATQSNAWGPFYPQTPYIGAAGNEKGRDQRRTLVETGALARSLKISPSVSNSRLEVAGAYKSPYATFTHYGGWMQPWGNKYAAAKFIVPRPWISAVFNGTHGLQKFDAAGMVEKEIKTAWSTQFG